MSKVVSGKLSSLVVGDGPDLGLLMAPGGGGGGGSNTANDSGGSAGNQVSWAFSQM